MIDEFFAVLSHELVKTYENFLNGTTLFIPCYINLQTGTVFSKSGDKAGEIVYAGWTALGEERDYLWRVNDRKGRLVGKLEIRCQDGPPGKLLFVSAALSTLDYDELNQPIITEVFSAKIIAPEDDPNTVRYFNQELVAALKDSNDLPRHVQEKGTHYVPAPLAGEYIIPLYYFAAP